MKLKLPHDIIIERISKNQYVKHIIDTHETSYGVTQTKTTQPMEMSDVVITLLRYSKKKLIPMLKILLNEFDKNDLIVVGTNTDMYSMSRNRTMSIIELCIDYSHVTAIEYLITLSDVDFNLCGNTQTHVLHKLLFVDSATMARAKILELLLPHIDFDPDITIISELVNISYTYFKVLYDLIIKSKIKNTIDNEDIEIYYQTSTPSIKQKLINDFPSTIVPIAINNGDEQLINGAIKDIFLF